MDSISLSQSVSKEFGNEKTSMSELYFGDLEKRIDAITTEVIEKGNTVLDTYKVLSDAISGGMGSVWRVHHQSWNTDLAMKRPQPRFFAEGGDAKKKQFIEECENWINLGLHPNIVSCYYVREIGGVPTIFSEWMDNGSLKDRIADGSLYEGTEAEVQERILDIAIQAARGLQYSHENGLIHQDMKPGNLLLSKDWDAKVADFGLAKAKSDLEKSETAKTSGYTLAYCPKEQSEGATPEKWMDVYAWALTVLEMYAGKRLWETGAEAKERFDEYPAKCLYTIPDEMQTILQFGLSDKQLAFADIERELTNLYSVTTGMAYLRSSAKASDTIGSLNNRALSFLDIGMPDAAVALWNQALSADAHHIDAHYNYLLYLLRHQQKRDDEVIKELQMNVDAQKAGLPELIRQEYPMLTLQTDYMTAKSDGKRKGFLQNMQSCVITDQEIVAYCIQTTISMIGRFSFVDPDEKPVTVSLRNYQKEKKGVLACALCRNGKNAVLLCGDVSFCLYDIIHNREIRSGKPIPKLKKFGCNCTDVTLSPDEKWIAVHSKDRKEKTVYLVSVPDFRLTFESDMNFVGFTSDSRCVLRGKVSRMKEALFLVNEDGAVSEVFRFERMIEKTLEYCGERSAFLGYVYRNTGEAFYLDDSFHKAQTDAVILQDAVEVLFFDADRSLLCTLGEFGHVFFWDTSAKKLMFTFSSEFQNRSKNRRALYFADDDTLLFWRKEGYSTWDYVELSDLPDRRQSAQWRLSVIESSQKRLEEEKRKRMLEQRFEVCRQSGNIEGMLETHRRYSERIENEAEISRVWQMETALDAVAKKGEIRAVRLAGKTDASSLRKRSFEPENAAYVHIRGDRILAFGKALDCTEYTLDGEKTGVYFGEPPQRNELLKEDIRQSPEDRYPILIAVDAKGENIIYQTAVTSLNAGYCSRIRIYLRNLKTGKTVKLEDFTGEKYANVCQVDFLFDGSILFAPLPVYSMSYSPEQQKEENRLRSVRRISATDGTLMTDYHNHEAKRFILNPERTLFLTVRKNAANASSCLYRVDGRILGRWNEYKDDALFLPGEKYLFFHTTIDDSNWMSRSYSLTFWDIRERKPVRNVKLSGQGYEDFSCDPSGRVIYSVDRNDQQTSIYHIEYDFHL